MRFALCKYIFPNLKFVKGVSIFMQEYISEFEIGQPFPKKAPAEGQRAIVMALCPSCVRACIRKPCLQNTSPQKLLTGFLPNFKGMFLRWSSFKFLQIILFHEEVWLPWKTK